MRRLGTDMMALACIAGGALVSGAATVALLEDDGRPHPVECATVSEVDHTSVVVRVGGGERSNAIVVAPRVRMHQPHCVSVGEFQWSDSEQRDLQMARVRMEAAMEKLELKRMELNEANIRIREMNFPVEGLEEEITLEIQRALDQEMSRLDEELRRLDEIGR